MLIKFMHRHVLTQGIENDLPIPSLVFGVIGLFLLRQSDLQSGAWLQKRRARYNSL